MFHPLLTKLVNYQNINNYLGKFGSNLVAFSKDVNHNHPDIPEVYDKFFDKDSKIAQRIYESLDVIDYSNNKKLNEFLPFITKAAISRISNIHKSIDTPLKNNHCIRLLACEKHKNICRGNKKSKYIDLESFCNGMDKITWDSYSSNFNLFIKNNADRDAYLSNLKKKVNKFKELGCINIYNSLKDELNTFNEQFNSSFEYFNIKLLNASIILAKLNNYTFNEDEKIIVKKDKKYYPTIVPVFSLLNIFKKDFIDYIKSFDENYSIFDHFLLLFSEETIKDDNLILLGEKDSKCYFIKEYYLSDIINNNIVSLKVNYNVNKKYNN